jgi:hypothetical protein
LGVAVKAELAWAVKWVAVVVVSPWEVERGLRPLALVVCGGLWEVLTGPWGAADGGGAWGRAVGREGSWRPPGIGSVRGPSFLLQDSQHSLL